MSLMKPMDETFPIERQLAIDAAPVVLIDLFTFDAADEEQFLDAWKDDSGLMKRQPGSASRASSQRSSIAPSAKARPI